MSEESSPKSGPSSQVNVLVEFQNSRRCVRAQRLEDLPAKICSTINDLFKVAVTLEVLPICASSVKVHGSHIMQRWSEEWKCFVDVVSIVEVADGDRITIIPAPSKPLVR